MRRSYRDRDYSFGQMMLNLRSAIGLTQTGLAEQLGVSRFAVGEWEAGNKYPKFDHLKGIIELAIQHRAFSAGQEVEEIRTLWKAARQKVFLDETWLAAHLAAGSVGVAGAPDVLHPVNGTRVDWGDALAVPSFYGREWELTLLKAWVVEKRCRVVSVRGMGGIGKSSLVVKLMRQVAEHFEIVIWRSLRDIPTCEVLLNDLLQVLSPYAPIDTFASFERRLSRLGEHLRTTRVLMVLDNLESLLTEGENSGHIRPGYEGFGHFLRQSARTEHQSCVLLTSREKPGDLAPYESGLGPVRALRLSRLDTEACEQLLAERGVGSGESERRQLIEAYVGNPLALKIVAETILDLFGGEIAPFLEQGAVIFGGIRDLLEEQFARLSALEQSVLFWLAILREPVTLDDVLARLVAPKPRDRLLEAVEALHRRSLIERGQKAGTFTLQSVVLEYATGRLITEVSDEIEHGRLSRLIEHALELAHVEDHVREVQERLIAGQVLAHLRSVLTQQAGVEAQLLSLLAHLVTQDGDAQGYAPANLVTLLRLQRGNLCNLDLSNLILRDTYLQGVEMRDSSLAGSALLESVFSETFDTIIAIAASANGDYWAGASRSGEVWLWETKGHTLYRTWQAHADLVWTLAFSPDGKTLVSGSWDGLIKLWDVASGVLLWSGFHRSHVNALAFSPDGNRIASSGGYTTILWNVTQSAPIQILPSPYTVISVAWSPDGRWVITGDTEGNLSIWEYHQTMPAACTQTISAHTRLITGLDFSPDGSVLASASYDGTVKLWEVPGGQLYKTFAGHSERVQRVAWSPDGRILASSGFEKRIWLWEVEQNHYHATLQGHLDMVIGLAFTPDSRYLLSSGGGVLRVWDVESSQCLRVLKGSAISILDIDWGPDSAQLVSAGADASVTIWDIDNPIPSRILRGHRRIVLGVSWRSDGQQVASSAWDSLIRLWNPTTGDVVQDRHAIDVVGNLLFGVAWSPDGRRLASASFLRGVQMFDMASFQRVWATDQFPIWIRCLAWSPDGAQLAGGGEEGTVYLWDSAYGTLLQRLIRHEGMVTSVAWSPDGALLASVGGRQFGELLVWDVSGGTCVASFGDHPTMITAVTWDARGDLLVSGDSQGVLRWWNVQRGDCVLMQQAHEGTIHALRRSPDGTMLASCGSDGAIRLWHMDSGALLQTLRRDRPYERLNITGIRGLTMAQKRILRALGAIEH